MPKDFNYDMADILNEEREAKMREEKLKRDGPRKGRVPPEWKDLAKKIRDEQKAIGTRKFREVAYTLFLEELKRLHPEDKRVQLITRDVFFKTYL